MLLIQVELEKNYTGRCMAANPYEYKQGDLDVRGFLPEHQPKVNGFVLLFPGGSKV